MSASLFVLNKLQHENLMLFSSYSTTQRLSACSAFLVVTRSFLASFAFLSKPQPGLDTRRYFSLQYSLSGTRCSMELVKQK